MLDGCHAVNVKCMLLYVRIKISMKNSTYFFHLSSMTETITRRCVQEALMYHIYRLQVQKLEI